MAGVEIVAERDVGVYADAIGAWLARDPLRTNLIASLLEARRRGLHPVEDDIVLLRFVEGGEVVGAAIRTPPMPMLVADLPDAAVDALAAALDAYAPGTTAFNGARQVVEPLAAAVADRTGGSLRVHRSTGRFRLDEVVPPAPAVGAPGPADEPDGPLVVDWTRRFHADVDDPGQPPPDGVVLRRVAAGQFWLWRVDGEPVAMAALTPPAYGFVRVNLVYTPPRQRRRGYASALVAHLAQRVLDAGDTPTLFTDLANPTSNKIYRAIGFRLVDETATVEVVLAPTPGRGARGYPR